MSKPQQANTPLQKAYTRINRRRIALCRGSIRQKNNLFVNLAGKFATLVYLKGMAA